jgi:hypothetical protein
MADGFRAGFVVHQIILSRLRPSFEVNWYEAGTLSHRREGIATRNTRKQQVTGRQVAGQTRLM